MLSRLVKSLSRSSEPASGSGRVVYDPLLTLDLPLAMSVTSGFNAIAHAVEALYAEQANPVTAMMAEEGIRALSRGMPLLARDPHGLDGRSACLYGAWLCGLVLRTTGMALHHKLCHVLGGSWNLPHAEPHTIVLPHAVAYNCAAAPEAMKRIERAMGSSNAAIGIFAASIDIVSEAVYRDSCGLRALSSLPVRVVRK